jgi:hypothetical protein
MMPTVILLYPPDCRGRPVAWQTFRHILRVGGYSGRIPIAILSFARSTAFWYELKTLGIASPEMPTGIDLT